MKKWPVTLSTTEPFNYVGIIKVRQGNLNTEILQATITENGKPYDLTGCRVTIQTIIDSYQVERSCEITDSKNGVVEYAFDDYTMQKTGKHIANLQISKGASVINTTQDFAYFVIQAVSKSPGETGSYWATMDDLMNDMRDFINAGKGDFDKWFETVKNIIYGIDPGGQIIKELVDARKGIDGTVYQSLKARLEAEYYQLYTLLSHKVDDLVTLQDDNFTANHDVVKIGEINDSTEQGALVIATIDSKTQNVFSLVKVGEI